VLDVETYDAGEIAAADRHGNRIVQAFYPEMFVALGYPVRVKRTDQLWRYIDLMHETRTRFNIAHLLKGLTTEEFDLFKRVTRVVDEHATRQFGMRAHATAALLRALYVLRLIKIVTGDSRPTVLEVGPGSGYLAMLLVIEGYPYIGTDVVQAFYLYQSHMLSQVAKNLRELAAEDGDVLTVEQPAPGTAIHIPWWKWVTLTPEKIKLSAGIMTSNHVLCEMHPSSMAYLSVVGPRILSNHAGGGKFIFEGWGYDLLHSRELVARKFVEHGMRLCHDEYAMSAMVLTDQVERWLGKPMPEKKIMDALPPNVQPSGWPLLRRRVGAVLNNVPRVKWLAQRTYDALTRSPPLQPLGVVTGPRGPHPLSVQLTEGMAAVIARAKVHEPELQAYLTSYFSGSVPRSEDEVFFELIGTRQ
jgi:hypothetical protein